MKKKSFTDIMPPAQASAVGGQLPDWADKIDGIVKGINQLVESYYKLSGKVPGNPLLSAPGDSAAGMGLSFSEAREAKKAEMVKNKQITGGEELDYFKELLGGLIKSSQYLKTLGYGEKPIGEVFYELPFSLDQTVEFLEKLYQKHFGR